MIGLDRKCIADGCAAAKAATNTSVDDDARRRRCERARRYSRGLHRADPRDEHLDVLARFPMPQLLRDGTHDEDQRMPMNLCVCSESRKRFGSAFAASTASATFSGL